MRLLWTGIYFAFVVPFVWVWDNGWLCPVLELTVGLAFVLHGWLRRDETIFRLIANDELIEWTYAGRQHRVRCEDVVSVEDGQRGEAPGTGIRILVEDGKSVIEQPWMSLQQYIELRRFLARRFGARYHDRSLRAKWLLGDPHEQAKEGAEARPEDTGGS